MSVFGVFPDVVNTASAVAILDVATASPHGSEVPNKDAAEGGSDGKKVGRDLRSDGVTGLIRMRFFSGVLALGGANFLAVEI